MSTESVPTFLVDSHCHVDLFKNESAIVESIDRLRIHTIAVTNAPFVFHHTAALGATSEYLHPAIGMHPELITEHGKRLDEMWAILDAVRFVGEIGLDYTTNAPDVRQKQRTAFEAIIARCAATRDKVLTVHSRRAAADVITMLGDQYPGTVILHWFSGSKSELRKAIRFGMYFSVNPAMTRTDAGRALISELPIDRVLTETDGPFVQVDGAPAVPKDVGLSLAYLATVWKVEVAEAQRVVSSNFTRSCLTTPVQTKA